MKIKNVAFLVLALGTFMFSARVFAHHGAATYDAKLTTVKGTVTDFQFMNPHSELLFDVTGSGGTIEKWTAECPSATTMARLGWSRTIFKHGDQVTFTGNVAKSGVKIMRLRKLLLPSGKEMMIDRGEDYAE